MAKGAKWGDQWGSNPHSQVHSLVCRSRYTMISINLSPGAGRTFRSWLSGLNRTQENWRRVKESNLHSFHHGRFSKPVSAPRRLYPPNAPARTLGMRGSRSKPTGIEISGPWSRTPQMPWQEPSELLNCYSIVKDHFMDRQGIEP